MRDETTLSPCVLPLQHSHGYRAVEQDTGTFTSQVTNYIWICLGLETQIKRNKNHIFVQHYNLIVYAELDRLDSLSEKTQSMGICFTWKLILQMGCWDVCICHLQIHLKIYCSIRIKAFAVDSVTCCASYI